MTKPCNELLWSVVGKPVAVCKEPYGTEHDHSDRSIVERLNSGCAVRFDSSDIEVRASLWIVNGDIAQVRILEDDE